MYIPFQPVLFWFGWRSMRFVNTTSTMKSFRPDGREVCQYNDYNELVDLVDKDCLVQETNSAGHSIQVK